MYRQSPSPLAVFVRDVQASDLTAVAHAAGLVDATDGVLALAWATVDLERAVADAGLHAIPAGHEDLLGATVARLDGSPGRLLIVEPDTEGRAAAFLARHGEGLCAVYVSGPGGRAGGADTGAVARIRSVAGRWGPFVIALGEGDHGPAQQRGSGRPV